MSFRDRYATLRQPAHQVKEERPAPDGLPAYQAFTTDPTNRRTPARLRISFGSGPVSLLSYAYLSEVLCTSHQRLSLVFTSCVITLEGRNLFALLEALQEDKVRGLECFQAGTFAPPAEGAPVITRIRRQSFRAFEREMDAEEHSAPR